MRLEDQLCIPLLLSNTTARRTRRTVLTTLGKKTVHPQTANSAAFNTRC
jgi:hypothetical protein